MKSGRLVVAVVGVVLAAQVTAVPVVIAAGPVVVPFAYTGAEQSWVVPAGVTSIHVALVGGTGGSGGLVGGAAGGSGRVIQGDLAVVPGDTLYVEVGGNGAVGLTSNGGAGGFNGGGTGGSGASQGGGGGGGGASDLRTVARGSAGSLDSRLIVAAGGGGGGGGSPSFAGGAAGSAGSGADSLSGGGAGTAFAGGDGGLGVSAVSNGVAGSLGNGGAAGASDSSPSGGGGGGGAGLFGGGGGAGGTGFASAGGGGGSSYTGAATNTSVAIDPTGTPTITITHAAANPGPGGSVGASVTVPESAACLELTTPAIDFGTHPLGTVDAAATPDITVTNCSGLSESIFASATDATGPNALWTLTDAAASCADTLGLDTYRLRLAGGGTPVELSTLNKSLASVGAGLGSTHTARIDLACPGSTGAGTTMTLQILFLATTEG